MTRLAVTVGDPAGIGPEIILKALADPMIKRVARPLILGDWGVLQRTRVRRKRPKLICWQPGQRLLPMLDDPKAFTVCSLSALSARDSRPGVAAKIAGHGTFSYIRVAAKLALSKVADAIATAERALALARALPDQVALIPVLEKALAAYRDRQLP